MVECCGKYLTWKHEVVSVLASALDFTPVDCGDIAAARYIEPMACLWIKLAFTGMGADFISKLSSRK
jgi:predicted dinucleotide-binding enzyme